MRGAGEDTRRGACVVVYEVVDAVTSCLVIKPLIDHSVIGEPHLRKLIPKHFILSSLSEHLEEHLGDILISTSSTITATMSSQSVPKTTKAWTVEGSNGFDSLTYHESRDIPKVGDKEVLVKSTY